MIPGPSHTLRSLRPALCCPRLRVLALKSHPVCAARRRRHRGPLRSCTQMARVTGRAAPRARLDTHRPPRTMPGERRLRATLAGSGAGDDQTAAPRRRRHIDDPRLPAGVALRMSQAFVYDIGRLEGCSLADGWSVRT
ncbi:hypothetical protein C8Q80DRAFT_689557 [Daedaleopsis nitida]|nr:hypothetical protein C8Q80DRAFT_689557 [Daedaleopsis nitida]